MKVGFLLAGLLFLFNPNINIIDILPDAIGYGLILYGILPISRADVHFSEAGRFFKYLFIVELCKLPSLYLYALISSDEQLYILIFSLVFGILEAVFGVLAWNAFFGGLSIYAEENERYLTAKRKRTQIMTLIFTLVKPIVCILPDLTLLSDDRYGVVTGTGIHSLKNYRGAFTVFAFVIVLIVGIVWLILTFSYIKGIKKESAFLGRLQEKVASFYTESKTFLYRQLSMLFGVLFAAAILCLELKVEGYSLLPPMINAVLFVAFFFLLRKIFKKTAKIGLFAALAYLVFSASAWIASVLYAGEYYIEDVGMGFAETISYIVARDFDAFDGLLVITVLSVLSSLAFSVMMWQLVTLFSQTISLYTGNPESLLPEKEQSDVIREHDKRVDREIKQSLSRPLGFLRAASLVTALCSAVFPLLQIYFYSFFMIDLVIRILFVIFFAVYVSKLRAAVEAKGGIDLD